MLTQSNIIEHFPTAGGIQKHSKHHHRHHPSRPAIITRVNNLVVPYRRHMRAFSGGGFLNVTGILIIIIIIGLLLHIMKKK